MITATKINLETVVRTKLPPLPGSVLRISGLLQDYNVSQQKIAEAIGFDPMLASRVLRLANSPMYPFQQSVTRLSAAVSALGNKAIYELVLMGAFADSFGREIRNTVIGRDIWLHALAVAITARELSTSLGMRGTDEAFSCGLLHDIGSLLLMRADPETYTAIFEEGSRHDLSELEKEVFGFDHAQVGALAAKRWNLSEPVCNMFLYHHNPVDAPQATFITHIVSVADRLAYLKNQRLDYDETFFAASSVITLKVTAAQLDAIWEKVLVNLREVIKGFFSSGA
jgi:putative nucleotidyltransferase with HDIG domain